MKKRAYFNLVFALLFAFGTLTTGAMSASMSTLDGAEWESIITLPVGKEAGQVGYELGVQGGSNRGPQALTVSPDGTIYLLDSLHQRVHVIVDGSVSGTIALPSSVYPMDIVARSDGLYILDSSDSVLHVSYAGDLLKDYDLPPGLTTDKIYRLSAAPSKVVIWASNYREFDLTNLPASVDLEAGVKEKDFSLSGITAPDGKRWIGMSGGVTSSILAAKDASVSATIETKGLFGTARLVGFDKAAQPYMVVEDLYDASGALGVELTVRRYDASGLVSGVARLPGEEFALPVNRAVEVASDGTIYAMVPGINGTAIFRVTLGRTYASLATRPSLSEEAIPDQLDLDPAPLTRLQARDRAYRMSSNTSTREGWNWSSRYDRFLNCSARGSIPKPTQLNVPNGTVVYGIPYTWGGYDSPWTRSDGQAWANWHGALTYTPGNCKAGPGGPLVGKTDDQCYAAPGCEPISGWYSGSAGIDCSGFIAAASGKSFPNKPGTGYGSPQYPGLRDADVSYDWNGNPNVLNSVLRAQPMNFFGTTGHVLFYEYGAPDAASIFTLESTIDGAGSSAGQGAKQWNRTWSYLRGYLYHRSWWPRNYNGIGGDGPREPRTAQGFGSACYQLRGQSVWYKFTVSSARNITLNNIYDGDPDLYIYSGNEWSTNSELTLVGRSIAGGYNPESVYVSSAGTYWARVYIYSVNSYVTCVGFNIGW